MVQIYNSEKYTGPELSEFATFPYPLSAFQKRAIQSIIEGHHTLVTAPTGSGKTLPAEFAIRHFAAQFRKVIYTSPIKALSNQKFYEFQQKFPDISFGLITGDNKINPAASVLIMTTEILMNSLFRPSAQESESDLFQIDIQQELACVVFDEVHYINDANRGHVWEKTIMKLAPMTHIQMLMLSATMDQPAQFAAWIESHCLGKSTVVCETKHRVVPLGHYLFVSATEALFKKLKDKTTEQEYRGQIINRLLPLQDAQGRFQETALAQTAKVLQSLKTKQVEIHRKFVLNRLLEHLRDNEMLPALAFILSRKQVEQCAHEITTNLLPFDSKIPYTTRQECEKLLRAKLPNWHEYVILPEYDRLVSLLEKGIGIHHSGMIPVFREIVEMFISAKNIQLLIATESFAIGLDCPIKTVIFTHFVKFDGRRERLLEPHEYKQMSGRAGRRGIDKIGYVVHCANLFPMPSNTEYRHLLSGLPEPFKSKFAVDEGLVIKMIAAAPATISQMTEFAAASYLHESIQKQAEQQKNSLALLEHRAIVAATTATATPFTVCVEYLDMAEKRTFSDHKRQKELTRQMDKIKAENPHLENDLKIVKNGKELAEQIAKTRKEIAATECLFQAQISQVCQFLCDIDILTDGGGGGPLSEWSLTELGRIAASFQEINGIVMANLIQSTRWFASLTPQQLAALLAGFCATTATQETAAKTDIIDAVEDDLVIQSCLRILSEKYEFLEDYKYGAGFQNNDDFITKEDMNRLPGPIYEWCELADEQECRAFIQRRIVEERGISIGDFVKAILKIVAIKKELERAAEQFEQTELRHKLSKIEELVCKFIATSQSLYL